MNQPEEWLNKLVGSATLKKWIFNFFFFIWLHLEGRRTLQQSTVGSGIEHEETTAPA